MPWDVMQTNKRTSGPGGVLLRIFGRGVPPASPNPDPISDQKGLLFEERDPGNEVEKKRMLLTSLVVSKMIWI